jgi:hypothetical protein
LFSSINYVVFLDENMRHRGTPGWGDLLARVRTGTCTVRDLEFINTTCSSAGAATLMESGVKDVYCPVITILNDVRHHVNSSCLEAFAAARGKPILAIPAHYRDSPVPKSLYDIGDEKTGRLAMLLLLVEGMPVTTTLNRADDGYMNGTLGFLKEVVWAAGETPASIERKGRIEIRYYTRLPKHVVVYPLQDTYHDDVPLMVVPPTTRSIGTANLPFRAKSSTITIHQLPLSPAFAITTDKCQGLTLDSCILAPQREVSRQPATQALYVALSRVRDPAKMRLIAPLTLDDLTYFRPSDQLARLDEDLRKKQVEEFQ